MKDKKIVLLSILITALLLLSACAQNNAEKLPQVEDSAFMMNTLVQMRAQGEKAEEAVEKSMKKIKRIENLMSKTIKSSDIYKLNNNPGRKIKVNKETLIVLRKAKEYAELTDGNFDPALGTLVDLWDIGGANPTVPLEAEINKALKFSGYQYLKLYQDSAEITKAGVKIDLGAIVKGYAAEEVKKITEQYKIEHAFINLGGNVLVIGNKTDGSPWKIGIQDPRAGRGNIAAVVDAVDKTIVTSGNYERYFEEDGKIYHHILNPKTGYPSENNLLSVSIISNDSFDADALSTSVYVMGLEQGMNFIEKISAVEVMFITDDLKVYLSPGLEDIIEVNNPDFKVIEE